MWSTNLKLNKIIFLNISYQRHVYMFKKNNLLIYTSLISLWTLKSDLLKTEKCDICGFSLEVFLWNPRNKISSCTSILFPRKLVLSDSWSNCNSSCQALWRSHCAWWILWCGWKCYTICYVWMQRWTYLWLTANCIKIDWIVVHLII